MWAEQIRQWLHKETRDKMPDASNWQKVVTIMQEELCNGTLANESTWHTVILITKGDSGYLRRIDIIGVPWKMATSLLNQHFTAAITYYDALHGFWEGRGTGTSTLDAKMLQ